MDKKIINACRKGRLYGYIENYYQELSKEELKQIISEVIWVAECRLSEEDQVAFENEIADSLEENYGEKK